MIQGRRLGEHGVEGPVRNFISTMYSTLCEVRFGVYLVPVKMFTSILYFNVLPRFEECRI